MSTFFNDLWEFAPEDQKWDKAVPVNAPPPARAHHSVVAYNGKMYVFFGLGASGALNDIWAYDPAAKTWTQQPSSGQSPSARYDNTSVASDDRIYVFWGLNTAGVLADYFMWEYAPATGIWTRKASLSAGWRYGHGAANVNGKVVVYGGYGNSTCLNDVREYVLPANLWSPVYLEDDEGNLPPCRYDFSVSPLGGNRLLVTGGRDASGTEVSNVLVFDFTNLRWEERRPLPISRAEHAEAMISSALLPPNIYSPAVAIASQPDDASILVFGGQRNGQPIAETLVYLLWYRINLPVIQK